MRPVLLLSVSVILVRCFKNSADCLRTSFPYGSCTLRLSMAIACCTACLGPRLLQAFMPRSPTTHTCDAPLNVLCTPRTHSRAMASTALARCARAMRALGGVLFSSGALTLPRDIQLLSRLCTAWLVTRVLWFALAGCMRCPGSLQQPSGTSTTPVQPNAPIRTLGQARQHTNRVCR